MKASLKRLLRTSFSVERLSGRDDYGNPTYIVVLVDTCVISTTEQRLGDSSVTAQNITGRQTDGSHVLICDSVDIRVRDRIRFNDVVGVASTVETYYDLKAAPAALQVTVEEDVQP